MYTSHVTRKCKECFTHAKTFIKVKTLQKFYFYNNKDKTWNIQTGTSATG